MAALLGRGLRRSLDCVGGGGDGIYNTTNNQHPYYYHRRSCWSSPFAAYYIVVFFLNGVAIVAGIFSQFDFHYNSHVYQSQRLDSWYLTNAIFGILHILAALYIVYKIQEPNLPTPVLITTTVTTIHHPSPSAPPDYSYVPPTTTDYGGVVTAVPVVASAAPPKPQNKFSKWLLRDTRREGKSYTYPTQVDPFPTSVTPYMAAPISSPLPLPQISISPRASTNTTPTTEPESWARIKFVLCENKVVAVYIVVCFIYLAWHYFALDNYYVGMYQHGMYAVQRCTNAFIGAGPASFAFSVALCLCRRREL